MSQDLSEVFGSPAAASLRGLLPRRGDGTAAHEVETARPTHLTAVPAVAQDVAPAPVDESITVAVDDVTVDDDVPAPDVADVPTNAATDVDLPGDDDLTAGAVADVAVPSPRTPTRAGRPGQTSVTDANRPTTNRSATKPTTAKRAATKPAAADRATGTGRETTNRRWGVARIACREHVDLLVLLALRHGPADGRGVITRLRESSGGRLDAPERTIHTTLHRLTRNRLLARRPDHASGRHVYAMTAAGERAARSRLREWHALARAVDAVAGSDDDS